MTTYVADTHALIWYFFKPSRLGPSAQAALSVCELPPLTSEDILNSATLTTIPDIFDRLIVFEARKRNASLLTRDEVLTRSGIASVVW